MERETIARLLDGLGSLHCACFRKWPVSCKWLLFLPHHASRWKATRPQCRGCSAAVSHCLTGGFMLSVSPAPGAPDQGCLRGGQGAGERGVHSPAQANSMNPPGPWPCPSSPRHNPPLPLPLFSFPLLLILPLSLSLSPLAPVTSKPDLRPTGPDPRTGLSQPAYREPAWWSPDALVEGEQRKKEGGKQPL